MRRGYMTRRRKHLIKNNQFHIIYKIKINLFTFCARSFDILIANIFLQNLCSVCAVRSQSLLRAIRITRPKRILKKIKKKVQKIDIILNNVSIKYLQSYAQKLELQSYFNWYL